MLRTIVLLLVIATPLLSQDLLVDSIDREFAGTLIEITDTDIIFQIQGETEPVQYPFWAVKRVKLADGRLAFEDGKTYVAKPTLPVEARPAEPMPTVPKPEEPQPIEAEPEAPAQPRFDPATGELIPPEPTEPELAEPEPAKIEAAAVGAPPLFTKAVLRTMAQNNAKMNHNTARWGVGGGCLGCGGMYACAIGVGIVVYVIAGRLSYESVFFGKMPYGIGMSAVAGGLLTAELLAKSPTSVSLPAELAGATPQLREQYRQLYRAEARKLKRKSIYGGIAGLAGGILILGSVL